MSNKSVCVEITDSVLVNREYDYHFKHQQFRY